MDAGTLVYSANPPGLQTIESETMAALATSLEPLAALGHRSQDEISQEPLEPRSEAIAARKLEIEDTNARATELPVQPKSQADQMVSNESRTLPLPTPEPSGHAPPSNTAYSDPKAHASHEGTYFLT